MFKNNTLIFCLLFYASSSLAFNSNAILELEWQHYTSDPSLKTQMNDYISLKWDQKLDLYKGPFYFDAHVQAEYALDASKIFYFNVPELYFFYKYDLEKPLYNINSIELNVGRKIKEWSVADEYWDMGLWNPLSRWNPLHPETNGLIGSFLTVTSNQWSLDFFIGALYLPNQEPQIMEKDGTIYSRSRWFLPLPDQVDALGIDIRYLPHSPFIYDTLFQQSYLLNFKIWSDTPIVHYWMKWSIADKPVNHLFFILNKKNLFKIGKEEGAEGNVYQQITILPVRQRILSTEWGFDYNDFSTVFTLESVGMREADTSPEGWNFFNHRESFTYYSVLLKYNFSPTTFLQAGYVQTWFKDYNINLIDALRRKRPSTLHKHKILKGIGLDWQTEFVSSKGLKRIFNINYRHSILNEGSWLFFKALYYVTPEIYTSVTFDVLGARSNKDYFLDLFRHNDYFSWRIAYDF